MANNSPAENINVFVRFRPVNSVEEEHSGYESPVTYLPDERTVSIKDSYRQSTSTFSYDRVFSPSSTQTELYNLVGPSVVQAVLSGINAAVIAYGQTSAGKTHTMYGNANADGSNAGLVPRLLHSLFDRVAHPDMNEHINASISFVQIYKEHVMDLFNPSIQTCGIREDRKLGLWITDATTIPVNSQQEALKLMAIGDKRRVVACTKANAESSRSHSVFIVSIHCRHLFDNTETFAQLYLVDLAGSECIEKTGSEGERLEEAKTINTSLLALRGVIAALVGKKAHVPYRDSKITRLLQNSFGGNAKTFLIVCCSPSAYNIRETFSSLRFATTSSSIQNRPTQNVQRSREELMRLIQRTNNEIAKARLRIAELQRVLAQQMQEDDEPQEVSLITTPPPPHLLCPLSGVLMRNPVVAMDGLTYDKAALLAFFAQHQRAPTEGVLDLRYLPNAALQAEAARYP